jgi:hypothetical protein
LNDIVGLSFGLVMKAVMVPNALWLGIMSAHKEDGGLGVKDLELQNRCMLIKFVDKLFSI